MAQLATLSRFGRFGWSARPGPKGYAVAVLSVLAAAAVASEFHTAAPASTLTLAVIVSTWLGGTRPGMVAIGLALVALVGHVGLLAVERLAYFLFIASFIVWVIAAERTTSESLRRAIALLEIQNETLNREKVEALALEDRLRKSEAELRLVLDTIPTLAWTLRPDGTIEFLSRQWLEYSGMSLDAALTQANSSIHPDDFPAVRDKWHGVFARGEDHEDEMRLRRADGEYRRFLVRTVPLKDESGRIVRWYGTSTDIEDRKRAERVMEETAGRLQQLSRRLLEVQEEERRHLARELHDEFGQLLAAVNVRLHAARAVAGEAAQPGLADCAELLKLAGEQVRSLALELRPGNLETAGLDGALRTLARQHQQRTGIEVEVAGEVDRVAGDVAMACFRVVQEALTNVTRHARARRVRIELRRDDARLAISVRDDGIGFDVDRTLGDAAAQGHLGVVGMRERMQIVGGSLLLSSRTGEGTEIVVSVPRVRPGMPPAFET